jgi:hypothetical protein
MFCHKRAAPQKGTLGNNPARLDSWLAGLRLEVFNPASQTVTKSRIKPASRKQKA